MATSAADAGADSDWAAVVTVSAGVESSGLQYAVNDRLAHTIAYGGSWAVVMALPPIFGVLAIPISLLLLAVVWVISDLVHRRWCQAAPPSSTATTDYAPLRRRRLPRR